MLRNELIAQIEELLDEQMQALQTPMDSIDVFAYTDRRGKISDLLRQLVEETPHSNGRAPETNGKV